MNMYSRRFFIILFSLTLHFSYLAFALFPEAANEEDFVSFGSNSTFRWAVMKDGTAVITDVITYNNEREEEYRPTTIQIPAKLEGHDVSHIGYFFSFGEYYSPVPGSVRTITVESGSKYFTSQGGVLFSKDMTTLYRYPESNSAISYIIPSSVKYIYHDAFNDCEILTSVTIPSGVTEIGYEAFEDCESLKSLTLPDSMEKIWKNAFKDCISLTNFTIPPNVSSIGRNIFGECEGLTSITVAAGNKYYKSQNGVLFDFNMKTLIAFPANKNVSKYIVPDGVEEIAYAAFEDANILQTVVLPGTLKRIGAYAFCVSKISSINIPQNLIYIGEDAFMGCYDLDR